MPRAAARPAVPRSPADLARQLAWAVDPATILDSLRLDHDPWQVDLLRSSDPRILLNCSRQVGKTTTTAVLALAHAMFAPPDKPATVLIFAPAGRQSDEFLTKVTRYYGQLGKPVPRGSDRISQLDFANGSRIIPLPNNEEAIRGYAATLVIIDEAARVPDELYKAVRPMLGVHKGRLICLSSPFGKRGWFYHSWIDPESHWKRIKITADDCPRLGKDFLEEERLAHGEIWFRQEYYCSFEQIEGLVYPDLVERCLTDELPPAAAIACTFGGTDWGYNNPAALLVGQLDKDDVLWITEEVYGSRMTMDGPIAGNDKHNAGDVVARASELQRRCGILKWYCDPAEPRSIERFRRADLPANPANNDIMPGIQAVTARINTGRLKVHRRCQNLINEAGLYRYPTEDERKIVGEKPIDADNHALAALRYMVAGIDRTRAPQSSPAPLASEKPGAVQQARYGKPETTADMGREDDDPDEPREVRERRHREWLDDHGWEHFG